MTEAAERWAPIPDYEDRYEASDLGRIRSLVCKTGPRPAPRLVRGGRHTWGYRTVSLHGRGRRQVTCLVHRLVLSAFVGPCPENMEARHLNNDRADNRLANLAWGTRVENARDKETHGTVARGRRHGSHTQPHRWARGDAHHSRRMRHLLPRGENHPNSKLTNTQREQIAAHKGFIRLCSLAEVFEVSACTILKVQKDHKRSA